MPSSELGVAWDLFKRNWRAFVLAELAIVAAWVILALAVVAVHRSPIPVAVELAIWLVLHVGFLWFSAAVMTVLQLMALQAVDGEAPQFGVGRIPLERGGHYLLAALIHWAAVFAGLCLLIVPGIVIAARWALFRVAYAAGAPTALSALREAATISASRRWPLLRLLTLCWALNL